MKQYLSVKQLPLLIALVLAVGSLFTAIPPVLRFFLCLASAVLSAWPLALPCVKAFLEKKAPDTVLLLLFGCLLCLICGAFAAAAFSLLFYRLGVMLLPLYYEKLRGRLDAEHETVPFPGSVSGFREVPEPSQGFMPFCKRWLCYFLPAAASVAAVVLVLSGAVSVPEAVRRSAALFMLGGEASFFAAFALCDCSSVLHSAKEGVLFSGDSLQKLYETDALYMELREPETIGPATVYSADPEQYPPRTMLMLAALIWNAGENPLGAALNTVFPESPDPSQVQQYREPEGLGSVAMIHDRIVILGNAKLMNRVELPFVPFDSEKPVFHMAIDKTYLGWIAMNSDFSDWSEWTDIRRDSGFYVFSGPQDFSEHRFPEERVLILSSGPRHEPATERDCYAALGAFGTDADIVVSDCGRGGAALLLRRLKAARSRRSRSFLTILAVKLLLLILAVCGVLPVFLCIPVEILAVMASWYLAVLPE